MFRDGLVIVCARGLLALLPIFARLVSESAAGYGLLLGCFGAGAVLGAVALEPARSRWSTEVVVSAGVAIVGIAMVVTARVHMLVALAVVMVIGGAGWIVFISLISALIQNLAPDWVRARVLAVVMLIFQGGMAVGSALWGVIAERAGIPIALMWAGLGTIATATLGLAWRLPDATVDVSPWNHWRLPAIVKDVGPELD